MRLFTIHTISELSTFKRSQVLCYKIVILFICYYNGNTHLNYVNPRLTLLVRDLSRNRIATFIEKLAHCLWFFGKIRVVTTMCQFFDKRGYPVSVVQAGYHRAQQIDRQAALQTAEKENTDRIPFTLTFHPHNHAVKSIILKNFKLLQNDSETGTIFSQPPLISFKRDKNIGNFLVRSSFQTNDQSGTFKCTRSRCKTCSFIHNVEKISGPKRSIKITDHFTCTSANVIYCITCTYCNKLYIGETGRRPGDRFREHLRDVERNDKGASKPVARHTLISLIIQNNIWQFPAFPYILAVRKAAKH